MNFIFNYFINYKFKQQKKKIDKAWNDASIIACVNIKYVTLSEKILECIDIFSSRGYSGYITLRVNSTFIRKLRENALFSELDYLPGLGSSSVEEVCGILDNKWAVVLNPFVKNDCIIMTVGLELNSEYLAAIRVFGN